MTVNGKQCVNASGVARLVYEMDPHDVNDTMRPLVESFRAFVDAHLVIDSMRAEPLGLDGVLWDLVGAELKDLMHRRTEGLRQTSIPFREVAAILFGRAEEWSRQS